MNGMLKQELQIISDAFKRSPGFWIWISFLTALIFFGAHALLMSLIHSLEILEISHSIPWGMMVSNYVFLVGSSIGLCLVSSLGWVFGLQRFEPIGKRCVFLALITIIFGLASIGLHLGHPERGAIYMPLSPNLRSAMWWMAMFYPPYIVFVAGWYWLLARAELVKLAAESEGFKASIYRLIALEGLKDYLYRRLPLEKLEAWIYRLFPLERMGLALNSDGADLRWTRLIACLALTFGLLAYIVEGSLFAHTEARPFWYGALYSLDFLLGASFCGFAWLLALGIMTYKIKKEEIPSKLMDLFFEMATILAVLLSVGLLFTAYKMGHGLFEPTKAKTIILFLNGPFSLAFWLFEVAIGLVLPTWILLYAARHKKITGVLIGAIMVLMGYFVKRYDFMVATQVYPLIHGQTPMPSYLPPIMEVLLIGGILGALFLTYTLAVKFLPLKEERSYSEH